MVQPASIKILVTGAGGQLAHEFRSLAHQYPAFAFTFVAKLDLDITLRSRVREYVAELKPAAIINCAAYTNVERAEDDRETAMMANADAVKFLAEACAEQEALLVHFSTDYVFDGKSQKAYREDDAVKPLNFYGESKLQGELIIREMLHRYFIIRASWLYSLHGHNFYKTMLRLARERGELRVVSDQVASPTYAASLAADVLYLLDKTLRRTEHVKYGLYHYSEHGEASWCDFAKEIMKQHGMEVPVHAVTTSEFPTRAERPAYSKLDSSAFEKLIGRSIGTWQQGLVHCVAAEQKQA